MADLRSILKKHGLKFTENRKVILEQFLAVNYALSYNDIDASISKSLDKVTVYRTLKSFEESGIIHEVLDGGAQIKYALCHLGTCSSHDHHDAHVHFKCFDCDKTFCLESTKIPAIQLPQGYQINKQSVNISGICKACAN